MKKFTVKEAIFLKKKAMTEAVGFIQKYLRTKNVLTITLKSHLYIEGVINSIIKSSIQNIPDKRILYMEFATKVTILRQLGFENLTGDYNTFAKLVALNKLRNKFSHNIDFKVTPNDKNLKILLENLKEKPNSSVVANLKRAILSLLGSMCSIRDMQSTAPFLTNIICNKKYYEKDRAFLFPKILDIYKEAGLPEFLKALKNSGQ